ncbi:hypothetical protein PQX77_007444 [Marasmius sp. AFHP31]|nr:hypothetical protein PQX77_007444 [Marasmius sp. AFHP31]
MVGYVDYIRELAHRLKERNAIECLSLKTIPGIGSNGRFSVEGIFHGAADFANPMTNTCLNITNLRLSLRLSEEVAHVIHYICSFPRLESLFLKFTRLQAALHSTTWTPSAHRLPLVTLKTLDLYVIFPTTRPTVKDLWYRWMKTHPPSSLRLSHLSLVISIMQSDHAINPARVFELCNKQFLKVLRLQIGARSRLSDTPDIDTLVSKIIDVSALTSLEILQIKILDVQTHKSSSSFIRLFTCIIRRISSTELRKLTIILEKPFKDDDLDETLVKEDWDLLDSVIQALPSLPVLEVLISSDSDDWDEHEKMLKEGFWRCRKAGKLVLQAQEKPEKVWPWT